MSESPENLSACRAVCNDLKFRMLAARQNWKGFACVGIMKDWNHVSKYSPKVSRRNFRNENHHFSKPFFKRL